MPAGLAGDPERLALFAVVGLSSFYFISSLVVARSLRRDRRELLAARDSLQKTLERMTLIQRLLADALTQAPEAVWERMSTTLLAFFGCERATIFQLDPKGRLVSRYAHGLELPVKVNAGEGIAGSVSVSRRAHAANDAYADPLFSPAIDRLTGFKTGNLLACPIVHQGKTVGVVELVNKPGGFLPADVEAFAQLESHLAAIFVQFRLQERQEEMTAQMNHVEKMAAIGRLAGGMAHEINNPLSSILGFTQLLLNSPATSPDALKDLLKIDSEARRIQSIVHNVLSFSRLAPAQLAEVDLPGIVESSLLLVGHELKGRQVRVDKRLAADLPPIYGDANSLKQVFINLVLNALQAMDACSGGTLTVSVEASPDRERVVAEVSDTGPGIGEDAIDKVFEPFFTTKPAGKGTGLGLYVTQGIVERHRAKIEVESAEGKGATFRVVFPALEAVAREDAARLLESGGAPD